ncbi:MAG TPA: cytochrome c3 family protein [Acidobacteriota bacterium]|nr:cytochrome c3 family protein [Acidobacteriota bacterium]
MSRPGFLARLALPAAVAFLAVAVPLSGQPKDEDCLVCHGDSGLKGAQGRSLFVDAAKFTASIHGSAGIACVDCHADLAKVSDFPHAEKLKPVDCASCHQDAAASIGASAHGAAHSGPAPSAVLCKDCHGTHEIRPGDDPASRTFPLNIPETCTACHLGRVRTERGPAFVEQYLQSVHYRALSKSGLSSAATCVSCHGGHDVRPVGDARSKVARPKIIGTCGACHAGIERDYLEGVHGKAYVKGSGDVPVCTDCHAEHDIRAPADLGSIVYATKVAAVCARCHDDEGLARQYGLLTSRLKTYAASYHGMASKSGETRVANCASCHGHHDIRPSTDPRSSVNPANLAVTCGTCHPGAGANFSKGRIHVVSERTENRWAYTVKVVYLVVIGGLISVFLAFIAADLYRRLRIRWTR